MAEMGGAYRRLEQNLGFRSGIRSYGSKTEFFESAYAATGLGTPRDPGIFPGGRDRGTIRFLDAMSGPGKFGMEIEERYKEDHMGSDGRVPQLLIAFNDVVSQQLMPLKRDGRETIQTDVRKLGSACDSEEPFLVAGVRYGLKDLPEGQLPVALSALHSVLEDGGRLVVADMTSYSAQAQQGIILVHGAKQVLAGRAVAEEGFCYVPRHEEWLYSLRDAGFRNVEAASRGLTSEIKIADWRGQFGKGADDDEMIARMRDITRLVAGQNPAFAEEVRVRSRDGEWFLSWPICVYVGIK